ncbi:4Fe-4S dicluster domain-containing protein [Thermosulfurimonas dismutans]|uniref:Molybdopterin oxydoreductase, iron-sulfur subunit beta n=1 Tax=Thermosulfurimonas dismutans TaxID=999894 RepID=A0A179D5P8_9BACT|nr:4Fe-4S dicluster domain-containing protein [Thermosulfurimonas dismutans]OAQ21430.1 Molybdopterin oxydoreductase, iron-sulfur subunit beta [Thermosulfurimonas dismutans]
MTRVSMLYDMQACVRCFACSVQCGIENRARLARDGRGNTEKVLADRRPELRYIFPILRVGGTFPTAMPVTELRHCMHCENAPCARRCPAAAIEVKPYGVVVLHEEKCIGCRACLEACPFDVPNFNAKFGKTYKCFMCYDRIEAGLSPACVEACLAKALYFGTREEVLEEAYRRAENYEKHLGEKFQVYGAEKVSDATGYLHWVTVGPAAYLEDYALRPGAERGQIEALDAVRTIGWVLFGASAAGIIGHFLYSLGKEEQE